MSSHSVDWRAYFLAKLANKTQEERELILSGVCSDVKGFPTEAEHKAIKEIIRKRRELISNATPK
jgi:hypothetical protein